MDPWKVTIGALFLVVSAAVLFTSGTVTDGTTFYLAGAASMAVAAGSWAITRPW